MGNYRSFGDTKFIPRLDQMAFSRIVNSSGSKKATELFEQVIDSIYDFEKKLLIGFPAEGHQSGYYSDNVSALDVEFVQNFLESHNISALNTRLFKSSDEQTFTLTIASAEKTEDKGKLLE